MVAFDWNDLLVGREFDGKFLKNIKSPPLAHKKSSTYFLLLSSLGYSSRQNLHTTKSELSSFVTAFSVLRFSRSFFSMNESQAAAAGQGTKQKEQATTAVHDEDDSAVKTPHQPCFQYLVLYRQV